MNSLGLQNKKLSIIIPVYFNEESIDELYNRIQKISVNLPELEIIFVDDGSKDGSLDKIKELSSKDVCVTGIKLSRNFGSFNACLASLTYCTGTCTVIMSADLQDPPELIEDFVKTWEDGAKVIIGVRANRGDPINQRTA